MRTRLFSVLLVVILLGGCASVGTIRSKINTPEFQAQNLPERTIRVVVVEDGSRNREEIKKFVQKVSGQIEKQKGISLEVTHWLPIRWERRNYGAMLNQLAETVYPIRNEFDVAIGFTNFTALNFLMMLAGLPMPQGIIDDSLRRFIIIWRLDDSVVLHEIFHAMIFDHGHSNWGLMAGMQFQVMPFTPSVNKTIYLTEKDWAKVNKFRDFRKKPQLNPEDMQDELSAKIISLYLPDAGGEQIILKNLSRGLHYFSLNAASVMTIDVGNNKRIFFDGEEVWNGQCQIITFFPWGEVYVDGLRIWPSKVNRFIFPNEKND